MYRQLGVTNRSENDEIRGRARTPGPQRFTLPRSAPNCWTASATEARPKRCTTCGDPGTTQTAARSDEGCAANGHDWTCANGLGLSRSDRRESESNSREQHEPYAASARPGPEPLAGQCPAQRRHAGALRARVRRDGADLERDHPSTPPTGSTAGRRWRCRRCSHTTKFGVAHSRLVQEAQMIFNEALHDEAAGSTGAPRERV